MVLYREKRLAIPVASNPWAKKVSQKLNLVRRGRKLSVYVAAKQLGITVGQYIYLEAGKALPPPALSTRLRRWMTTSETFEGQKVHESILAPGLKKKDHLILKAVLPKEQARAFKQKAASLGMQMSSLLVLLIRRFLADRAMFATLSEASNELAIARAYTALHDSPDLKVILETDIDLMVKAQMFPAPPIEQPEIVEIANMPVDKLVVDDLTEPLQEDFDE